MRSLLILATALAGLGPVTAHARPPTVGYAQATGYFKEDSRPTLYQPLNLLDGREITVWCTRTSDSLEDRLQFGFKGTARIDEVRVYTGNGADDSTFKEFSRARKLSLRGPAGARTFTVADQRGLQVVRLDPPVRGSAVTLEVLDQYPAEDPESPVCLTDVVFYSEGKALNGSWLTQKLKYHPGRARMLGTWYAGLEGAPERFLSFYFDGTFRLVFDPLDPREESKVLIGTYEARRGSVVMKLRGQKGRVVGRFGSAPADEETGTVARRTLEFQGKTPEDLAGGFRDQM